jgi:hypothetical protein
MESYSLREIADLLQITEIELQDLIDSAIISSSIKGQFVLNKTDIRQYLKFLLDSDDTMLLKQEIEIKKRAKFIIKWFLI